MIKLGLTAALAALAAFWVATEARKRGWISTDAAQIFLAGAAGGLVGKWVALK